MPQGWYLGCWGVKSLNLNHTLCVFSQIKDTKHNKWDFYLVTWVMLQGWDCAGCQKFDLSEHDHVAYQIKWDD